MVCGLESDADLKDATLDSEETCSLGFWSAKDLLSMDKYESTKDGDPAVVTRRQIM